MRMNLVLLCDLMSRLFKNAGTIQQLRPPMRKMCGVFWPRRGERDLEMTPSRRGKPGSLRDRQAVQVSANHLNARAIDGVAVAIDDFPEDA